MIFPLAFPLLLGFFVLLLVLMVLVFELRILSYAYRKIGVPPRYMFVVLLVSLLAERSHEEALRRACAAGALAASRFGAQPSLPTAAEVDEIMAPG